MRIICGIGHSGSLCYPIKRIIGTLLYSYFISGILVKKHCCNELVEVFTTYVKNCLGIWTRQSNSLIPVCLRSGRWTDSSYGFKLHSSSQSWQSCWAHHQRYYTFSNVVVICLVLSQVLIDNTASNVLWVNKKVVCFSYTFV